MGICFQPTLVCPLKIPRPYRGGTLLLGLLTGESSSYIHTVITRVPCGKCVIHVSAITQNCTCSRQFFFFSSLFSVPMQNDSKTLTWQPATHPSQDGPGSSHVRNLQRPTIRLQGRHLVPRGNPDRAGTDWASEPRDESHASAAENSQVGTSHPHASVPMVSCCVMGSGKVPLCRDKAVFVLP